MELKEFGVKFYLHLVMRSVRHTGRIFDYKIDHSMHCLQVYHSSIKVDPELTHQACSCPLLPLKSHIKGPAPTAEPGIDISLEHWFT